MKNLYRPTHRNYFLLGFGSILSVYPLTSYHRFVPRDADADRMRSSWSQVGEDIKNAMATYAHEKEEPATNRGSAS